MARLFIIVRALIPQIGMPSVAIVPSLDPSKDYAGPGECDRFCSKISVLPGLPTMP
jgi:hypothetical protein